MPLARDGGAWYRAGLESLRTWVQIPLPGGAAPSYAAIAQISLCALSAVHSMAAPSLARAVMEQVKPDSLCESPVGHGPKF